MSEPEKTQGTRDRGGKKPYRKPDFKYEEVFETMALQCTKSTADSHCQPTKKTS